MDPTKQGFLQLLTESQNKPPLAAPAATGGAPANPGNPFQDPFRPVPAGVSPAGAPAASPSSKPPVTLPKPGNYGVTGTLPPIAQGMYNEHGKNCDGVQCGQFISNHMHQHGIDQTATHLSNTPSMAVHPDANGRVPNGTGVYFNPSRPNDPGTQHFGVVYTDANGVQRVIEDTSSGGNGHRSVRIDRKLEDIANQHPGHRFFHIPGN